MRCSITCNFTKALRLSFSSLFFSVFLIACNQLPKDSVNPDVEMVSEELAVGAVLTTSSLIDSASWDSSRQRLRIRGRAGTGDSLVRVTNATTYMDLGAVLVNSDLSWQYLAVIRNSAIVPCSVTATTATLTESVNVRNAPSNCSGSVISNPTPNLAPDGTIVTPVGNQTIFVGQSINFSASGSDPDGNLPLSYFWNFGGAAPNSIAQNPGNVNFSEVGTYTVSLTVSDSVGLADPSPASVTVNVVAFANQAPNGQILTPSGSTTVQAGQSISFTGVGSDPDFNTPLTYYWNFGGAAPNSTLASPGNVTFNTAGIYTVTFVVTDALGLSDPTPDTRTITVTSANTPPNGQIIAPVGNVTINAGQSVNFSGSGSDPNGNTPLTYLWNFGGAAPNSTSATPGNIMFSTAGTYTVTFTVRDSLGLADPTPDTRTVTVLGLSNQAPNSQIISPTTNTTIQAGQSISFTGVGSDPDFNTPLTYYWNFNGAAPNSTLASPGNITFNTAGTYTVTFMVTDSLGLSDPTPDTRTITVTAANNPPDGQIVSPTTSVTIAAGQSVNFSGIGTDPDGNTPLTYLWNFGGAAPNSTSATPGNVVFATAGTYTVTFTVRDSLGLSDPTPATRTITVNPVVVNNPPNGTITSPVVAPGTSLVIYGGESVYFAGTGSDPDGEPFGFMWNFSGAAANSSLPTPGNVTFTQSGTYRVTLTVTDSRGLSDPTPAEVNIIVLAVIPTNAAPNGSIDSPITDMTINPGETVFFSSSATDPDNNTPLHYHWNFNGAAPDVMVQTPGNVTFTTPGMYHVTMTVTDGLGLSDPTPATRMITVRDSAGTSTRPNGTITAPTSNVTIRVGDTVYFDGAGTNPNGGVLSYLWSFGGAAPSTTSRTPGNVTFLNAGVYTVRLNVRDSYGWQDPTPAEVTVTVQAFSNLNQAPESTIGSPATDITIYQGDTVNFTGSAYDIDGNTPLTYLWNFGGGASNSTALNPGNVVFNTAGTFVVSFSARDSLGLYDPTPARRVITVRPLSSSSYPPDGVITSPATDMVITAGQVVNFAGYATDPNNGTPFMYHWDFNGAVPASTAQNPGNVLFAQPGTYRVRLHVWDRDGLWDPQPAERVIIVNPANSYPNNLAPNGTITGPTTDRVINIGETVNFSASGTDPDGNTPLTYRWSFDGIVIAANAQNPGAVTFYQSGTYRVTMTVTDSFGKSDPTPAERIITVRTVGSNNQAPTANITSPTSNVTINIGGTVNFAGTGTDPDGNLPLRFYWDFAGAVPNVVGQNPGNVTFIQEGSFRVTLRTIDTRGLASTTVAERVITVQASQCNSSTNNIAPTANITSPTTSQTIPVGGSVYFSGSGYDPDSTGALTYVWLFSANNNPPNMLGQTPGNITFNTAGTYNVQLYVQDCAGAYSYPAMVTITVGSTTTNSAPNGTIVYPSNDVSIVRGGFVYFAGTAIDPNGDAVYYYWDFGGAAPASSYQTPGNVQFNYPGTYRVYLYVYDIYNNWDPTPALRTIVVQ